MVQLGIIVPIFDKTLDILYINKQATQIIRMFKIHQFNCTTSFQKSIFMNAKIFLSFISLNYQLVEGVNGVSTFIELYVFSF